jgi:enoyl-CoA hydratase/carnithine racemase
MDLPIADMAEAWVTLDETNKSSGFATIIMAREPVNSMNLEFWQRLQELLYQCEQDSAIRGIIFCR